MKRANGTGSIVKLGGNRRKPWAVRVPARNERGRVRQHYLSYHAKAADAQAALDEWCRTHQAPEESAANWTLQQVYDAWSATHFPKIGKKAVSGYTADWRYLEHLKNRKMRLITLDQWQSCIDGALQAGLAVSSTEKVRGLIRALDGYAMQRDITIKEYSQYTTLPKKAAKIEKDRLSDLQLAKLNKLVASGEPWADTVLILCYTGFRIAELLQLRPCDYDAEHGYVVGGLKTEAGRNRVVPIHPRVKPYFLAWVGKGGETIICKRNGTHISYQTYLNKFKRIMGEIGADNATPHWCRYTFMSRLHEAGADNLAIKRMAGHKEGNVTEHYTKLPPEYLMQELLKMA